MQHHVAFLKKEGGIMIKESCVGSYTEAINAINRGANRIELCENLAEGGTTPSYGTVKKLTESTNVPILVMIRPRGGDFLYSKEEIDIMIEDIKLLKTLNIAGFVLGVLNGENEIDYNLLKLLVKECDGKEITFHKAIDEIEVPLKDIPKLIEIGIKRILTSGRMVTAIEGTTLLNKMIEVANGNLTIVAAGRITVNNFDEVSALINTNEFHGKLIV